ncbi:MAG TPA: fatty acid desaturase [Labilithrix sp.]|jgi:fatty acid desaturase|nr:fatty acid desaturase [Labilithrix sp.]
MHAKPNIDLEGFVKELEALKAESDKMRDASDLEHLKKIERWGRLCTVAGYATGWIVPNPISALLLSQGRFTRFAIMGHHVLHGGYDRVPSVPERYTSKRFARGKRRLIDWMDWIVPEAWIFEHNALHHYHLGESQDPDDLGEVVRKNFSSESAREKKHLSFALTAMVWKLSFYAPSTLKQLRRRRNRIVPRGEVMEPRDFDVAFHPMHPEGRELWTRSIAPYALYQFVLVPSLFAFLGPLAVTNVALNSIGAELLTNAHAFLMIVPNHAGDDLYKFSTRARSKAEFYLRQVLGSTNYNCGSDLNDFVHGFLNYQIEHHLWPDATLRQYKWLQPRVKELCRRYGVPYVQESVWRRARKMLHFFTHAAEQKTWTEPLPAAETASGPTGEIRGTP